MANAVYHQTYNSFSGVDMQLVARGHIIGEAQGLSYTVTREKAPLYTMGSADPRSFSRGKRGIAGSMVFMVFNANALLESLRENAFYLANAYEVAESQQLRVPGDGGASVRLFNRTPTNDVDTTVVRPVGSQSEQGAANGTELDLDEKVIARARYHDQVLPFDVVLTAGNEYGHLARMEIHNVEIMNCGSGFSVDDINTDESCTWVATGVLPWYDQRYIDVRRGIANQAGTVAGRAGSGRS